MNRDLKMIRTLRTELATRSSEDKEDLFIEGYFAVFEKPTELWPGAFEEIAGGAFDKTLGNDIKALIDHEAMYVLGRNKSGTLDLESKEYGLWGQIKVNQNDSDAMNLYARVQRGDVDQCSFGFNIISEETEWRDDGTVKWRVTEIDLHEVSICTFPAYKDTGVQARKDEVTQHIVRQIEVRKQELKERLKDGTKTIDD